MAQRVYRKSTFNGVPVLFFEAEVNGRTRYAVSLPPTTPGYTNEHWFDTKWERRLFTLEATSPVVTNVPPAEYRDSGLALRLYPIKIWEN